MIHLHCLLLSRKITQKIQPHLVVCVMRQQDEWIVSLMLPRLTFFDSMCKESLEVGFLALLTNNWESTQAKRHLCQEQRKLPTTRNLNQATIQLQLSFLIATRSVGVARSWEELQWEVEETGHGQDNKRSAVVGCVYGVERRSTFVTTKCKIL